MRTAEVTKDFWVVLFIYYIIIICNCCELCVYLKLQLRETLVKLDSVGLWWCSTYFFFLVHDGTFFTFGVMLQIN